MIEERYRSTMYFCLGMVQNPNNLTLHYMYDMEVMRALIALTFFLDHMHFVCTSLSDEIIVDPL